MAEPRNRALRNLRLEANWTQEELAKAAGVSRQMVINYEVKGSRPHPVLARSIALALNQRLDRKQSNGWLSVTDLFPEVS